MTNTTLTSEARRTTALFATGSLLDEVHVRKHFEKKKDDAGPGVLILEDVPVFRSGTFRDSMGFQHTWEDIHMQQMIQHFDLLKNQQLFDAVPVRKGHPSFLTNAMDDLIGYHTSVRTEKRVNPADGIEYTYVLATYEVIDPVAQQKIQSGLWRNRSAEIGAFTTNAEAEFWPVYMGVAYVDIPAVDGLNGFMKQHSSTKYSMMTEDPVGNTPNNQAQTDGTGTTPPPTPPPAPPTLAAPQVPAQHSAPTAGNFQFSINGSTTTDFSAVQSHITALENFREETRTSARKAFAAQLAKENRILASDIPRYETFGMKLDDEAFGVWSEMLSSAPAPSILGEFAGAGAGGPQVGQSNHSLPTQGGTPPAVGGEQSKGDKELEDAKATVKMHGYAGMPKEQIKQTKSYARIMQSEPNFVL